MDSQTAESLLEFAEQARSDLGGLDARTVFGKLEHQYDELLGALEWFIDQGRTDEALRLSTSLAPFWMATKRLSEGSERLERVLQQPGGKDANRGRVLFEAALLAFWQGDDDRASALHNQALEIGCRIEDPTITALALGGLARIALRASDASEARKLCHEALAVTEGTADRAGRSGAMHVLAVAAQMAGDLLEARDLMSERIALGRELGNFAVVGLEAGNLSMVERQLGNLEQADALAREALSIYYRRGDEWAIPYGLSGLAAIATERGEFDRAATLIGAAEAMMEAQGAAWPPDERPHYERTVATLTDKMGSDIFERKRAMGCSMVTREAINFALGTR